MTITSSLANTTIAFIVLFAFYFIIHLIFLRKVNNQRQKNKIRIRVIYLLTITFTFIVARIWIVGFTHLLAVLGLVSAALVITNKENIMNMVGYLIISWRGLFYEGDLIQIQQHKGYVRSLGLFYFVLEKTSDITQGISGSVVRIPNGLTANHPLVNFSQKAQPLEQIVRCIFTKESNINEAKRILEEIVVSAMQQSKHFLANNHSKKALRFKAALSKVTILIKPKFDNPVGIELVARYYCYHTEQEKIEQLIQEAILTKFQNHSDCHLVC